MTFKVQEEVMPRSHSSCENQLIFLLIFVSTFSHILRCNLELFFFLVDLNQKSSN